MHVLKPVFVTKHQLLTLQFPLRFHLAIAVAGSLGSNRQSSCLCNIDCRQSSCLCRVNCWQSQRSYNNCLCHVSGRSGEYIITTVVDVLLKETMQRQNRIIHLFLSGEEVCCSENIRISTRGLCRGTHQVDANTIPGTIRFYGMQLWCHGLQFGGALRRWA